MSLEGAVVQYITWFAGAGLLALLVFHPKLAPNIITGLQALATRVTTFGRPS